MADVFLTHAVADREWANRIAEALTRSGLSVACERQTASEPAAPTQEDTFDSAGCVVLLWSLKSVTLGPIRAQATEASRRGILAAVLITDIRLPLGFRTTVVANLSSWDGSLEDHDFQRLLRTVQHILSTPAPRRGGPWTRMVSAALLPAAVRPPDLEPPSPTAPSVADEVPTRRPMPVATDSSASERTLFLCYRREDASDAAGRLYDRLAATYGSARVFMDIEGVPLGIDFVDHITDQIARCHAVIVMIGKQWLTAKDKKRRRRLDHPDDLVRAEIRAALQQKIPVIPVIVQGASMPAADALPDDIRLLARRNGIQLRPEQWRDGVDRLLKELDKVMTA